MIRRSQRYTVPAGDLGFEVAPYQEQFQTYPWWNQLFTRLVALIRGETVEDSVRRQLMRELRLKLSGQFPHIVNAKDGMLSEEFFAPMDRLARATKPVRELNRRVFQGTSSAFVRHLLREMDRELTERLEMALCPDESFGQNDSTTQEAIKAVRRQIADLLNNHRDRIAAQIGPVWHAAYSVARLSTQKLPSAPAIRNGLRRAPISLYREALPAIVARILETARRASPAAYDLVFGYLDPSNDPLSLRGEHLFNTLHQVRTALPLLDLVRLALEQPLYEPAIDDPPPDWWPTLVRDWYKRAAEEVPKRLLELRIDGIRDMERGLFEVEEPRSHFIPEILYPSACNAILNLVESERFRLHEQVVRRLLIDGRFYDLRLRDDLHQAAIQVEDAASLLQGLFQEPESPDSLAGEERRIRRYSKSVAVMHRQLHGLHLRYRRKIWETIHAFIDGVSDVAEMLDPTQPTSAPGDVAFVWPLESVRDWSGSSPPQQMLPELRESWSLAAQRISVLLRTELEVTSASRE